MAITFQRNLYNESKLKYIFIERTAHIFIVNKQFLLKSINLQLGDSAEEKK